MSGILTLIPSGRRGRHGLVVFLLSRSIGGRFIHGNVRPIQATLHVQHSHIIHIELIHLFCLYQSHQEMVSDRVSVVHVPSAAGMGVDIGDVCDQAERARVRHEVHVILARQRVVGNPKYV